MKNLTLTAITVIAATLSVIAADRTPTPDPTFTNPVICADMADPSIIRFNDEYFAVGTSSEWAPHLPIYQSTDLVNWTPIGHVLPDTPEWIMSSFWAPEWWLNHGKTYVYYTARKKADHISCIGVAVADSPRGPFTDCGPVVEFGREAIDPALLNDDGRLYITWKAFGLDNRPIEILAARLSDDGLRLEGEPFSLLRDDEGIGLEGQYWFHLGDYYYLIYSVRGCCGPGSDYAVAVARSREINGPYEKCPANPILHGGNSRVQSIGHGTITTAPDGSMYYLCHAYITNKNLSLGRQPVLMRLEMGDDLWPRFSTGDDATPDQPLPTDMAQAPKGDFVDRFNAPKLNPRWSWNFTDTRISTKVGKGKLTLHTGNLNSAVPGVLCLQPSTPTYAIETCVETHGASAKGLILYGDGGNYFAFGLGNDGKQLQISECIDGNLNSILSRKISTKTGHIFLKMAIDNGMVIGCLYSIDGKTWTAIDDFTPTGRTYQQWDRVARPGLFHKGSAKHPATFRYAALTAER